MVSRRGRASCIKRAQHFIKSVFFVRPGDPNGTSVTTITVRYSRISRSVLDADDLGNGPSCSVWARRSDICTTPELGEFDARNSGRHSRITADLQVIQAEVPRARHHPRCGDGPPARQSRPRRVQ